MLVVVVAVARVPVFAVQEVQVVRVGHRGVPALGTVHVHVPRVGEVERGHGRRDIVHVVDVEVVVVTDVEVDVEVRNGEYPHAGNQRVSGPSGHTR